jgi:hypothetical protein
MFLAIQYNFVNSNHKGFIGHRFFWIYLIPPQINQLDQMSSQYKRIFGEERNSHSRIMDGIEGDVIDAVQAKQSAQNRVNRQIQRFVPNANMLVPEGRGNLVFLELLLFWLLTCMGQQPQRDDQKRH